MIDTVLKQHPPLVALLQEDIIKEQKTIFGRKDTLSVEQIMRSAIYKELKHPEYRELEYHQIESRICAMFIKIDDLRPFSFQLFQKYISQISSDKLQKLLVELNKIAIGESIENLENQAEMYSKIKIRGINLNETYKN